MLKERYLHTLNLRGLRSRGIEKIGEGVPALLVLDMQDYFLEPCSHAFIPSAPDLIPLVQQLAEAFEARSLPVIFTRHLNTPDNAGMMGKWWRDTITRENPLSRIHHGFDTSWAAVLDKSQYDSFYGTELHMLLRQMEVTSVVVTGVMTHLCCETTARAAFVRGYDVFMPVDGTATLNRELHRATTLALSHGFTKPVSCDAVLQNLPNG